jgi:type VII secretion-associated serine protease mycosin
MPAALRGGRSRVGRRRLLAGLAAAVAVTVFMSPTAAHAETVREAQWQLRALQIDQVHRITTGQGVLVAQVDSGVEVNHPDLAGQVAQAVGMGAGSADGGSVDTDGHGTGIAALIVGKGGGDNHALGIAPGAKLLSIGASGGNGKYRPQDINDGIRWAADHGARVLNLSLSSIPDPTDADRQAIAYALARDVVVVAGAGNRAKGQTVVGNPANIPGVVAVGGTTKDGSFWSGSVSGPEMAIVAPGDAVVSADSRASGSKSGYSSAFGTSASSAIVSGAAALVRAKYPDLKAPDVINRLIRTADDAGSPGRDPQYGFGRLNILRALSADVPHVDKNPLGDPLAGASTAASSPPIIDHRPNPLNGKAIAGFAIMGVLFLGVIIGPIVLLATRRRRKQAPVGYGQYPPGPYPQGFNGAPGPYPPAGPYGQPGFQPTSNAAPHGQQWPGQPPGNAPQWTPPPGQGPQWAPSPGQGPQMAPPPSNGPPWTPPPGNASQWAPPPGPSAAPQPQSGLQPPSAGATSESTEH